MKKIISVVIILLLVVCTVSAMAEVTFNGIEFLSTDDVVINTLVEKGFANGAPTFSNEINTYLVINEDLGYQPTYVQGYQDVCFSQEVTGRGKIAGYPVKNLLLAYAYDGSYKLISVKVELIGADYEVMLEKLTKVYGTPDVKVVEEEGITSNIWKDGETAVLLYTESDGLNFTLIYGRTDTEDILASCLVTSDPDDISGL